MPRVYEVRYPDVRRGSRGEPPFSTALFRSYVGAEAFMGHCNKGATMTARDLTAEEFKLFERNGFFERTKHHG